MSIEQSTTLPPAQPVYVLRGHASQVHALHFLRGNLRLLSGDANGWVVVWSIPTKRAVAVWRPHKGPILGLGSWGHDRIITHGRDNKLYVWKLPEADESAFSTTLPIDDAISERKSPWLLNSLDVNALNFCSFAMCPYLRSEMPCSTNEASPVLIAIPGLQDGHINVTSLPAEDRVATIPSPPDTETGMIMAIGLHFANDELTVLAGYESGHAAVWRQDNTSKKWQVSYMSKPHAQPILSLAVVPDGKSFFTSAADAIIARHALHGDGSSTEVKALQTRHAGQQSLSVRPSGDIFATAGWDSRIRVYSVKSMKELAVLKWHKEGCYATAFAELTAPPPTANGSTPSGGEVTKRELMVSERRDEKAKTTHWLAAGGKDGKISLWDIY